MLLWKRHVPGGPCPGNEKLEAIFRLMVLGMLIASREITLEMITLLSGWRHSGFHVFWGRIFLLP
jgi:hypothetical protein